MAPGWPGNVRELENCVERMIALSRGGHLDIGALGLAPAAVAAPAMEQAGADYPSLDEYMLNREREIVKWAMAKSDSNISEAARLLKVPRTTLASKRARLFPLLASSGEPAEGDG